MGASLDPNPVDPAMKRVGTVLDEKWTLDRLLGIGGMAAVYAATHRNGARAAIKLFPFSVTTSAEFAERILREGVLANKIGHPAVVRVLDDHLDREREHAYLVMELLHGETARQRVERLGPMSPLEALEFSLELLDCLQAAHDKGVVHRDIKPENLFLTDTGELKVLDFGVARALDGKSSSVTRTGAMLGTPAYMSPEQARGKPSEISPRSDIYSAGATLLFLVTGEFVHQGESAQEIMVRAAWTPAPKTSERGLGLPLPLADVIDKACAFEPKDRYQTAAGMRRALEAARGALQADGGADAPIARPARSLRAARRSTPPNRVSRSDEATVLERPTRVPVTRAVRKRAPLVIGASAVAMTVFSFLLFSRAHAGHPEDDESTPVEPLAAPKAPAAQRPAPPATTDRALLADEPAAAPPALDPAARVASVAPSPVASPAPQRRAPVTRPTRPPTTQQGTSGPRVSAAPKGAPTPIARPPSTERDVGY